MKQKPAISWIASRRWPWVTGIVFLLIASVVLAYQTKEKVKASPSHKIDLPSVTLEIVKIKKDVKRLSAIGTVKAAQGVQLGAASSGTVTSINFHSGETVKAGQVLATLNNGEIKAAVMKDRVNLHLATLNQKRVEKLFKKQYASTQDVDKAISQVKLAKAQLFSDEASLQNTIIKAPFSGQSGIRQINLGQYISAGQTIVSLQDLDELYVDFTVPEKKSDLLHVGDPITLISHQENSYTRQGKVVALGANMSKDTRSLPVRAEIFQPRHGLLPGMYVDVSVSLPEAKEKPVVPQGAIVYNPYGNLVYLYKKGVVTQHYVSLGKKEGRLVFINKGLRAGDRVVTEGQQKLYNGAHVQVAGS